jgi:hypothetical protein
LPGQKSDANGKFFTFGPVLAEKVNFLPIPSFFYSCDTKKTVLSSDLRRKEAAGGCHLQLAAMIKKLLLQAGGVQYGKHHL